MINLILWAVLGVALNVAGVGVLDQPWQFFLIMAVVMGIDFTSARRL